MKTEGDFNQMARFAKALGHPIRLKILSILANSSCCYTGDLTEELPVARSTMSQHFKELKEAGLIQGTYTPPKIKYCLEPENWAKAQQLFSDFFNQNSK